MNNRRKLVIALGAGTLALPFTLYAQSQTKVWRIGYLSPFSQVGTVTARAAFTQGLRDLGWIEGKNIAIEYRFADGKQALLPGLAAELVRLNVDVIVTSVTNDTQAARNATSMIPIVMTSVGDPVASGFVGTLARPGGNVTGLSQMVLDLVGKRLELLKKIVPKLSRVAVFMNPRGAASNLNWKEIQLPARALGIQLHPLEVQSVNDYDHAFAEATKARAGALFLMPDPVIDAQLKRIADFAIKSRLPSIFHLTSFADAGGLVAYGPDRDDMARRTATYVDKILNGAKPADLPVEQPTKFDLVVNKRTAKALGLKIPNSILVQATKVIE